MRPDVCWRCGSRSGLEHDGYWARCIDEPGCTARRDKQRDRSRQRGSVIHVFPGPCADPPPGACQWCGEPIVLTDPLDYRRRHRAFHRGDEHEVGERNCRSESARSRVWNARDALRNLAQHEGRTVLACVDCGQVVENLDGTYHGALMWEADHETPLEDGGQHEMANLRCRCVPCHRAKTVAEARARLSRLAVRKDYDD